MKNIFGFLLLTLTICSVNHHALAQIDAGSINRGYERQQDRNEQQRLRKAEAFQDFLDSKVANGERIDLSEAQNFRRMLEGGDPYLMTYVPDGAALEETVRSANQSATASRLSVQNDLAEVTLQKQAAMQKYIDSIYYMTPHLLRQKINNAFGSEVLEELIPQLDAMIAKARQNKITEYMNDPVTRSALDERELEELHGGADMPFFAERKAAWITIGRTNAKPQTDLSLDSEDDLVFIIGTLKKVSGLVGAASGCGQEAVASDAIRVTESALKAAIKNGIIEADLEEGIRSMNRSQAIKVRQQFESNPPVPCAEIPARLEALKSELGLL
jgi:hypothetical protein